MIIAKVSDFALTLEGSIALLWPQTDEGRAWRSEHIDEFATEFASGVVIEHRFLGDIVNGIHDANLTIKDIIDTRETT